MTKKMNRRKFIWSAITSGITLSIGSWWILDTANDVPNLIADMVRKKLDYLKIDEVGLNKFAEDFVKRGVHLARRYRIISPLYIHFDLFSSSKIDNVAIRAAKKFLISSDFFWKGSNESRIVKYTEYYDPYSLPCSNPFARFDD